MARLDKSAANKKKMEAIARPYVTQVYKDMGVDNPKMIEQSIKREVDWLIAWQREDKENKEISAKVKKMPASKKQPTIGPRYSYELDEVGREILAQLSVKPEPAKIDYRIMHIQNEVKARQVLEGLSLKSWEEIEAALVGIVLTSWSMSVDVAHNVERRRKVDNDLVRIYGEKHARKHQIEKLEEYFENIRKYAGPLMLAHIADKLHNSPPELIGHGRMVKL